MEDKDKVIERLKNENIELENKNKKLLKTIENLHMDIVKLEERIMGYA